MKALAIVTGVLTALLGIYGLCVPFGVFLGLGWLMGILYLVNGVELVVGAFGKKSLWQGVLGAVVALFGLLMLCNAGLRFMNDLMIAYFAGAAIVLYGGGLIYGGFKGLKESKLAGIAGIACGVLGVVVGLFAFAHPILTMISVGYIICLNVVVQGIGMVVLALAVKDPAKA